MCEETSKHRIPDSDRLPEGETVGIRPHQAGLELVDSGRPDALQLGLVRCDVGSAEGPVPGGSFAPRGFGRHGWKATSGGIPGRACA